MRVDSIWYSHWSFPVSNFFHLTYIPFRLSNGKVKWWNNRWVSSESCSLFQESCSYLARTWNSVIAHFYFSPMIVRVVHAQNYMDKQTDLLKCPFVILLVSVHIRLSALHKCIYGTKMSFQYNCLYIFNLIMSRAGMLGRWFILDSHSV